MNISIKSRIYFSFFILVSLFVLNAVFTIVHLQKIKELSRNVTEVIDPSILRVEEFNKMVVQSKMYSTNWVFLRANQNDKNALQKIHEVDYKALKQRLNKLSLQWHRNSLKDSLQLAFENFEAILSIEREIMNSLKEFRDYDDPVLKLQAEAIVEDDIIPRTAALTALLGKIMESKQKHRKEEQATIETSSQSIRQAIIIIAVTILCGALFLAMYLGRIIIRPITQIKEIINDLGKGRIRRIDHKDSGDEIGEMVKSVNHLSEKLQVTAEFAHSVGLRDFKIPFTPLSDEDTLGKALISMRDNLQISDARLNEAQRIAKLGSWEYDILNGQVFWSDQMFDIFDVSKSRFVPTYEAYMGFVHPDDRDMMNATVGNSIKNCQPFAVECRAISDANVPKTLFTQGSVILDDDGNVIKLYGVAQDISARKKDEASLEQKNKELEAKNRDLEQFAYVASHDLQEPLRTISSFVELLQKQYKGRFDDKADKYMVYIVQAMERMKVLIKDLLDYSRIGREKQVSVVNCNWMLEEVVADLNTVIHEASATIQSDHLPVVRGYSTEIKQLFQNLLSNAIKFRKKDLPPVVKITSVKKDKYWEFAVQDNGIGLEQKHSERIFVIFQRLHTRSEYQGSGIGLSHCKKIVELHGGKIWVDSTPGEGSIFRFTIRENEN